MTAAPKVSLGMPVYNGAASIERAIESLLAQTLHDFELIISDNGSDDRSAEIAAGYARTDRRIRIITSPANRGAAWNFDCVFRQATGQYFAWAAADDYWDPRYVGACVAVLDTHPEAVACVSQIQPVTSSGEAVGGAYKGMAIEGRSVRSRWRDALRNNLLHSATYAVIRREAVGRTRLLPAYVGSDHVFVTELALQGEILEIPEVLSYKSMPGAGEEYRSHRELLRYLGGRGRVPWLLWLRMTKELVISPFHVRPEGSPLPLLAMDAATSYISTGGWLNDTKRTAVRIRDAATARRR